MEALMLALEEYGITMAYGEYCVCILEGLQNIRHRRLFASISDRLPLETASNTPPLHSAWFITSTSLNTLSVPLRPPLRSRVANVLRTRLSGFFSASKANLRNAP